MKQVFAGILVGFVGGCVMHDNVKAKFKHCMLFAKKVAESYKAKMTEEEGK